jgi:hypothetical protein
MRRPTFYKKCTTGLVVVMLDGPAGDTPEKLEEAAKLLVRQS